MRPGTAARGNMYQYFPVGSISLWPNFTSAPERLQHVLQVTRGKHWAESGPGSVYVLGSCRQLCVWMWSFQRTVKLTQVYSLQVLFALCFINYTTVRVTCCSAACGLRAKQCDALSCDSVQSGDICKCCFNVHGCICSGKIIFCLTQQETHNESSVQLKSCKE